MVKYKQEGREEDFKEYSVSIGNINAITQHKLSITTGMLGSERCMTIESVRAKINKYIHRNIFIYEYFQLFY